MLALLQSLIFGAVGWVVILIALHDKATLASGAQFYLWYIPLNLLTLYPGAFLQGRMMMRSFNLVRASVQVSYSASLALLWASNHVDVRAALAASLFANTVTLSLCAAFVVRGRFLVLRASATELRSLITLGLKLHLGNVAFLLATRLDIVMLSFLVPTRVLGNYVVAAAVGALPLLIPSGASLVLFPLFSRRSRAQLDRPFARFMLLALLMTIAAAPVVILVSPLVLKWFFGGAFSGAAVISQILGLAGLVRGMSVMVSAALRGMGAPIRASVGDVVGLLVMATLLVPGIQLAYGEGAAISVLSGTSAALAWMVYNGMRVTGTSPRDLVRRWGVDIGALSGHGSGEN
jgi:O-antigen/teichoic acid export membrane protein